MRIRKPYVRKADRPLFVPQAEYEATLPIKSPIVNVRQPSGRPTKKRKKLPSRKRPIDPGTGCKLGSKGELISKAIRSSEYPAVAFQAVLTAIDKFYKDLGRPQSPAQVRRYAIISIDTLRRLHPDKNKNIQPGVYYSVTHRVYLKTHKQIGQSEQQA